MSKTNGIETLKVGDKAVQVQQYFGGPVRREFGVVTVVRVTPTQIVDSRGNRYRMTDGAKLPVASSDSRYLMSAAAYEAAPKS